MFKTLLLSIAGLFGINSFYEQPEMLMSTQINETIEIRTYPERFAAKAEVAGDKGDAFRLLFDYIGGENIKDPAKTSNSDDNGEKIEMTSPVQVDNQEKSASMIFFLPAKYTEYQQIPKPANSQVEIIVLPAETYAVLKFKGEPDAEKFKTKAEELKLMLAEQEKYEISGDFVNYVYDPPFTPAFLRENEILVPVTEI
jgi:hypothetical protein